MKKLLSILLAATMLFAFVACSDNTGVDENSEQPKTPEAIGVPMSVMALKGPTGMGLAYLMDANNKDETGNDYTFTLAGDPTQVSAAVIKGETDIACVPVNLASTLYNKTNGGIKVLAINTLGVLNVVAKGVEVNTIADLKGMTVYSTGQGANPEYILNNILTGNGLKVGEDVKVEFVSQPAELIAKVVGARKAVVIAPQPVATTITIQDTAAKIVIDLNDEWNKLNDKKLVMGCIIARSEFVEANHEAVEAFLKDYEASIKAVSENIDATAAACEEFQFIPKAPIAKKAIPYCNIVFEDGEDMKADLSAYLTFLHTANPKSVGGKLPADDFYYGK
jgi:NitT/TauT family transport system substrate-binding protein